MTLLVGKRLGGAQWVLAVVELEEVVVEVMRAGSRKVLFISLPVTTKLFST